MPGPEFGGEEHDRTLSRRSSSWDIAELEKNTVREDDESSVPDGKVQVEDESESRGGRRSNRGIERGTKRKAGEDVATVRHKPRTRIETEGRTAV